METAMCEREKERERERQDAVFVEDADGNWL
jgi:hypothetical protein